MPSKNTVRKAKRQLAAGKSPGTAASEFVREEIEHVRKGVHGARSTKQAIAIGLSKARRAGVPLKPPTRGRVKAETRKSAERAYRAGLGRRTPKAPSRRRGEAALRALRREPRSTASKSALSAQAKRAAAARRRRG